MPSASAETGDRPSATRGRKGLGPLVPVDDPADPRLTEYRDLNDTELRRHVEADRDIFVVEGRLAVDQLVRSEYEVQSLLVDDHQATLAGAVVDAVRARGVPVYVGSRAVVKATVGFSLHRGVVAVARRPGEPDARQVLAHAADRSGAGDGPPLVAVLEGLNDHENIGAMFRNAAAFGVGAVLLDPTSADPLYRRAVRVSVGHVLHTPFARLTPWPAGLDEVRGAGYVVAALAPRSGDPAEGGPPALSLPDLAAALTAGSLVSMLPVARVGGSPARLPAHRPRGVALLLGAEGPGLSPAALAAADVVVSIPMAADVDSINVATAAAIAFHRLSGS